MEDYRRGPRAWMNADGTPDLTVPRFEQRFSHDEAAQLPTFGFNNKEYITAGRLRGQGPIVYRAKDDTHTFNALHDTTKYRPVAPTGFTYGGKVYAAHAPVPPPRPNEDHRGGSYTPQLTHEHVPWNARDAPRQVLYNGQAYPSRQQVQDMFPNPTWNGERWAFSKK